jgi:hypothetical protein
MSYRITGLAPQQFADYWQMGEAELAARNVRRLQADSDHGFPCRVSLEDARVGETLLLLPYAHHDVAGPYRASGPIYIREQAQLARSHTDEVPMAFQRRLISVRAYDASGWMRTADVVQGDQLDAHMRACFQEPAIAYLHLHNARPGCFAARVNRY